MAKLFNKFLLLIGLFFFSISPILTINSEREILSNNAIEESLNDNKLLSENANAKVVAEPSEILRIADQYPSNILSIDPYYDFHSLLLPIVYDNLVDVDLDTGSILPGLAYQWVVTTDSKEWTFYLRNDVLFHDGSKFNATSVKFTFDRLFDPNNPLYAEGSWISLDTDIPLGSLEIINEFEIKFLFPEPYAPLILRLPLIPIISPNSFQDTNFTTPLGTGPYELDLISSNSTFFNFTRFSSHFQGLAPFKSIYYQSYSNLTEFQHVIELKQVDMIFTNNANAEIISGILISDLLELTPYWTVTSLNNIARHDLGWFNHNLDVLTDSNIRKAINHAIDNEAYINEIRGGLANPIRSLIPLNIPYHNPEIEGYEYNITEANRLLDEAGYNVYENGSRFELNIVSPNYAYDRGMFVCSSLETINITCNFESVSGGSRLLEGDFDIYVVGYQHVPDPSIMFDLLNSNGINNFGSYSNQAIDILTTLARQTPVRQEQELYYNVIQSVTQEESPYILLADLPLIYIRTRNITSYVGLDIYTRINFYFQTENQFNASFEEKIQLKSIKSAKLFINQQESIIINLVENIKVSSKPLYLPFTDSILSSQEQDIMVTVKMSHQVQDLIQTQQETGKFFEINVDHFNLEYTFRAYYDIDEIGSVSVDRLALFKWDTSGETWVEMPSLSSNTSFRFIETKLAGNVFLKLGETSMIKNLFATPIITFSVLLLMIGVVSFAFWAIRKNIKFFKWLKDNHGL